MADYVAIVTNVIKEELDRVAHEIESELKAEVNARMKRSGKRTGNAVASIHVEVDSETSRFVGSNINWGDSSDGGLHLYYFVNGNKPRNGGRIKPTRSRALHLKSIGDNVWAASVSPYSGTDVIKEVADRHR